MITLFEKFNEPDLRKVPKYVQCISIPEYRDKKFDYTVGNYYKITEVRGDPERAIEEFGINDYLPVECCTALKIMNDNGIPYFFFLTGIGREKFNKCFKIPDFSEEIDKYNI